MSETFAYDVFLSYSLKDKETAHALAQRLKRDGLRVWTDRKNLQRGLEQSRALVLCMSPAYFASEWSTLEGHTLLFRDPTIAQRRFIPLLVANCAMPDIIAQFATIDWRTQSVEVYERLLAACRGEEGGISEPAAVEERPNQARMILQGHTSNVYGVAVTPDSKMAVSGSRDKTLKVWDLATGQCRATFRGHTDGVLGVAVTPDGKMVVSGSRDKTLKVWDLATGQCRATFQGHTDGVLGVAVTPDGKTVVSGSWDKTLKVWDLATGQCRATLEGHTEGVYGVVVIPNGKTIVSSSADKTLKVWDLATGQYRATFEEHIDTVWSVAITSDGKTVVSASSDGTLRV